MRCPGAVGNLGIGRDHGGAPRVADGISEGGFGGGFILLEGRDHGPDGFHHDLVIEIIGLVHRAGAVFVERVGDAQGRFHALERVLAKLAQLPRQDCAVVEPDHGIGQLEVRPARTRLSGFDAGLALPAKPAAHPEVHKEPVEFARDAFRGRVKEFHIL